MADEKKSIFELIDKFGGYDGPFKEDWEKDDFKESKNQVAKIVNMSAAKYSPPAIVSTGITKLATKHSSYAIVPVVVAIDTSGMAGTIEVTCSNGTKQTAKRTATDRFETYFILSVKKSLSKPNLYNTQRYSFTATVKPIFQKNITDTRTVEITIDTEGKVFDNITTADNIGKQTECLCKKKSWTADDLKNVVTELRKKDIIQQNAKAIRDENGKIIGWENLTIYNDFINTKTKEEIQDKIFYFNNAEKLESKFRNYTAFSKQLNITFQKYQINTCLRKIHFLAQIYQETARFRATYEGTSGTGYFGGDFYQGRGMKQITHDYNYLDYYCYLNNSNLFDLYIKHRSSESESVTAFNKRTNNKYISVEEMKKVDELAVKISTDLYYACDSAGWYWWKNKINQYADKDDIVGVSAKVNKPTAINTTDTNQIVGYDNRYKFYLLLKEILNYEKCGK